MEHGFAENSSNSQLQEGNSDQVDDKILDAGEKLTALTTQTKLKSFFLILLSQLSPNYFCLPYTFYIFIYLKMQIKPKL